ncbi:MAG: hypothetical protein AAGI12_13740 [Pseudomonadota bacterium]
MKNLRKAWIKPVLRSKTELSDVTRTNMDVAMSVGGNGDEPVLYTKMQ